jgi:hypothetical protein
VSQYLDDRYLEWLYELILSSRVKNPNRTCHRLFNQLYLKEFIWFIPNDDNRLEDGRVLREEFLDTHDISEADLFWPGQKCSVLEMLVALTRRFAFLAGGDPRNHFWLFLRNLSFPPCSDRDYSRNPAVEREIDEILDRFIWRTYDYNGSGGLFPLMHPPRDQRNTEIWYQMNAYVIEKEGV